MGLALYFVTGCFLMIAINHVMLTSADELCISDGPVYNCSGKGIDRILNSTSSLTTGYAVLDLSFNHIQKLVPEDFSSQFVTLLHLNLSNNQISFIRQWSFGKLESLEHLDLSNNLLDGSTLSEDAFFNLSKVRKLSLEKNPLGTIKDEQFNFMDLPSLTDLDLSHCQISKIEDGGIRLTSLERLDLSWNSLEELTEETFKMLNELRVLDLSHNNIQTVTALPYMPELRHLNLDNNRISTLKIREEVSYMCDLLEVLSLRNNKIVRFLPNSLPWDLHFLTDQTVKIDLTYNPVQCDCRMAWIADDTMIKESNQTIRCEYPTSVRGRNMLTMSKTELVCGAPIAKILIIVGVAIVGLLAIAGFIFFFLSRRRFRRQRQTRKDSGKDYTAVYTKDESDAAVSMKISDEQRLLAEGEFDV